MTKRNDVTANEYIERLERVAAAAQMILMVSKNTTLLGQQATGLMLCPHGHSPRYPTHAIWCDECWGELQEALAWVMPEALPKNEREVELPELAQLKLLATDFNAALNEDRHELTYIIEKRLEKALRAAGYEKLAFPAMPKWQHPKKGGFWV